MVESKRVKVDNKKIYELCINKKYDIALKEIRLKFVGTRAIGNSSKVEVKISGKTDSADVELDIVNKDISNISESWNYVAEDSRYINNNDILKVKVSSIVDETYVLELVYAGEDVY